MRYLFAMLVVVGLSGCISSKEDVEKEEFEKKREVLEREIEILRLQKRKIMLEKQLEAAENIQLIFEPGTH